MSGKLSLIQSRNDLLETMSESDQVKYFKLMQLWFQKKINKATYDKEIIKLLNKTQNELHKRFILIFLHKHVTYSKHMYLNSEFNVPIKEEIEVSKPTVSNSCEDLGHIDKKMKVSHERDYYFEPVNEYKFIPSVNVDYDEGSLLNKNRDGYLMGLVQIIAWQQGINNGVPDTDVGVLVQSGLQVFIKNLLTNIVMLKKTFKHKSSFVCDFGKHVPNPWLKSSHIYRTPQSSRYPLVSSKSYLSEKRSFMQNENFQTAMDISNSVQFNLLNKKSSNSISIHDVLYVIMNNINNIIPLQDLQYTMYENILPIPNTYTN